MSGSVCVGYPAISETSLRALNVTVPPFTGQAAIDRFGDCTDPPILPCVQSSRRKTERLSEQRTRLFAEKVTGTLYVRQATSVFPRNAGETGASVRPDDSAPFDAQASSGLVAFAGETEP